MSRGSAGEYKVDEQELSRGSAGEYQADEITICSDFGAQKNKVLDCFHCFPIDTRQQSRGTTPAHLPYTRQLSPATLARSSA